MRLPLLFVLLYILFENGFSQNSFPVSRTFEKPERRQFDFWIGEWKVVNRFRQGDNSWQEEGTGHLKVWPVLDGKAITEFWDGKAKNDKTTKGFSIRYYDQQKKEWIACLNWPGPNNGGFFLMRGKFRFNRCEIFNRVTNPNKDLTINRYTFSDITDSTYRWNDGQSLDSGKTWQTNWIMENHRLSKIPAWPDVKDAFHTYTDNSFATLSEARKFDQMPGQWTGVLRDSSDNRIEENDILLKCWKVQNGIGIFYTIDGKKGFKEAGFLTYRDQNKVWLNLRLDNNPYSGIITQYWKVDTKNILFTEYSQLGPKSTTEVTHFDFINKTFLTISRQIRDDNSGAIVSSQNLSLKKQE